MWVGLWLHKKNILDEKTTHKLAKIFLLIFYPCLIFSFLLKNFTIQDIMSEKILPMSTFSIMIIGYLVGFLALKCVSFENNKQKNMFHFQCLLNNYSFLPLPIILMLYGENIASKHLFATLGAEFALWTVGIFCLTGDKINRNFFKNLFSPPVISILVSFFFILIKSFFVKYNFALPIVFKDINDSLFFVVDMFGKATIPVAMLVAGSRMYGIKFASIFNKQQFCLTLFRLIIIPAIIIFILRILPIRLEDYVKNIIVIVAIMPCAVNSVVFSEIFNSDTEFAAKSILLTHLFALVTIPFWLWVTKSITN
jgi:predicted permease